MELGIFDAILFAFTKCTELSFSEYRNNQRENSLFAFRSKPVNPTLNFFRTMLLGLLLPSLSFFGPFTGINAITKQYLVKFLVYATLLDGFKCLWLG